MKTLRTYGFTLIELMITIAVLAILTAIAIPAYNTYIDEAKYGALRSNIDSMRMFLEDYQLEEGTYVAAQWKADGSVATLDSTYGWRPDGDNGATDYTVTVNDAGDSFTVLARSINDNTVWVRCEDRMTNCCYPDTPDATSAACP